MPKTSHEGEIESQPKPKEEPVKSEETITVKKSDWDDIVKTVAMLKDTADAGRVARYESKHKGKTLHTGRINVLGEKIVVAFRMSEDFVGKLPNGVWAEKQIMELTLDDDTKVTMPYVEFAKISKKPATILGRSVDSETEVETLKLKLEDGRTVEIASQYFN